MKKSARASAPESSRSQQVERLTDAVNWLADEVRVVRDVLSEIREDLGWVTRNGIPGRNGEHPQVVRMARDPLSHDANERLEVQRSKLCPNSSMELSADRFDELVSEIAEAVTVVGQEQVNLLLTALDDARAKLLAAIKSPTATPKPKATADTKENIPPAPSSAKPSESGRLF